MFAGPSSMRRHEDDSLLSERYNEKDSDSEQNLSGRHQMIRLEKSRSSGRHVQHFLGLFLGFVLGAAVMSAFKAKQRMVVSCLPSLGVESSGDNLLTSFSRHY